VSWTAAAVDSIEARKRATDRKESKVVETSNRPKLTSTTFPVSSQIGADDDDDDDNDDYTSI